MIDEPDDGSQAVIHGIAADLEQHLASRHARAVDDEIFSALCLVLGDHIYSISDPVVAAQMLNSVHNAVTEAVFVNIVAGRAQAALLRDLDDAVGPESGKAN